VWDVEVAEVVKKLRGHEGVVNAVDAEAGVPGDNAAAPWDVSTSVAPWRVVSAGDDKTVRVWDARSSRRRGASLTIPHPAPVLAVRLRHASSPSILSAGLDNTLYEWDPRAPAAPLRALRAHSDSITGIDVSPDPAADLALTNAMDGTLVLWDLRAFVRGAGGDADESAAKRRVVRTFRGHTHADPGALLRCAFSPDGGMVAAGSSDRMMWAWDAETGEVRYKLPGHEGAVNDVRFSPVEPVVASAGNDGVVFLGEILM